MLIRHGGRAAVISRAEFAVLLEDMPFSFRLGSLFQGLQNCMQVGAWMLKIGVARFLIRPIVLCQLSA